MNFCRSNLRPISHSGFSKPALKKLFDGKKINPVLNFSREQFGIIKRETARRFSFSGVQDKISLIIEENQLVPAKEKGTYILKPIPTSEGMKLLADVPANEHLTMQIAEQVLKIKTPPNALVSFSDRSPAYLVRRFDISPETGEKLQQEDFCQLSNRSESTHGKNYKYDGSYEAAAQVIKAHCSSSIVQMENYFRQVFASYLLANGDAHLKNFSLLQTADGDLVLSPAYDLLATNIHFPNESRMALDLFVNHTTEFFEKNGFYGFQDFLEFSRRIKINEKRARDYMQQVLSRKDHVEPLIEASFLSSEGKSAYLKEFNDRILALTNPLH